MKKYKISQIDVEVVNEVALNNASALGNDTLVENINNMYEESYELDKWGDRIWK